MRSVEAGKNVLQYSLKTTKEALGIGEFQRARKNAGTVSPISAGLDGGLWGFIFPLSVKLKYEDPSKDSDSVVKRIFNPTMADAIIDFFIVSGLFWSGFSLEAAVAKLGWNTVAQIAPDVARLAKRKILQIEK